MKSATGWDVRSLKCVLGAACLLPFVGGLACNLGKTPEVCNDAVSNTRKAIAAEDFALARQWREYSYRQCEDATPLASIDQEIVQAEKRRLERDQAEAQAKSDTSKLLGVLKQFVASHRAAIDRASANILCAEPEKGAKKDERWCSGSRAVGTKYTLQFRYWDADKTAMQVVVEPPLPVTCPDLGAHTVNNSWNVPAVDGRSVPRTHCTITGGETAGLDALVSGANNAKVTVFSKSYLEKDARLQQMVTPK